MTDTNRQWTNKKAMLVSVFCLAVGMVGGWSIRSLQRGMSIRTAKAASIQGAGNGASPVNQMPVATQPSPAQLKEMADTHAAPLLDRLKSDPGNPDLLSSIGNVYYDAQQYPTALNYYARALRSRPSDAAVRTDMGTAYWYMGNADAAIGEFNKALTYHPHNPNTLFNLGLVKWKGKTDAAGAVADWKELLATNPGYEGKHKVEELMAEIKNNAAATPGGKAQ